LTPQRLSGFGAAVRAAGDRPDDLSAANLAWTRSASISCLCRNGDGVSRRAGRTRPRRSISPEFYLCIAVGGALGTQRADRTPALFNPFWSTDSAGARVRPSAATCSAARASSAVVGWGWVRFGGVRHSPPAPKGMEIFSCRWGPRLIWSSFLSHVLSPGSPSAIVGTPWLLHPGRARRRGGDRRYRPDFLAERDFYGTQMVQRHGGIQIFLHGTTRHGVQSLIPPSPRARLLLDGRATGRPVSRTVPAAVEPPPHRGRGSGQAPALPTPEASVIFYELDPASRDGA
jgi:hypothetical protein